MTLDLSSLEKAIIRMEQIVERSKNEDFMKTQDEITQHAIRAGVIQHFEVTYELCWKFIQRWIRENKTPEEADYPRTRKELFRMAARYELIKDPVAWFSYSDARNITSHTYNEEDAVSVYEITDEFLIDAKFLIERLKERND